MSAAAPLRAEGHPIGDVYLSREQIADRVAELGAEIGRHYDGTEPVLVAPLKSSAVFLVDLSRALGIPHEIEVVELEAYGGRGAGDAVRLVKDLDRPVRGRRVILVEDVVDTGLTLRYLSRTLEMREPADLAAVTLLDRPHRRLVDDVPLRWIGFTVPDELFAGYGLGLDERWRALPDLHLVVASQLPAAISAA
jgi:hypoxanthine phosphoribosyltransferase